MGESIYFFTNIGYDRYDTYGRASIHAGLRWHTLFSRV